jgi:hypothetical protein
VNRAQIILAAGQVALHLYIAWLNAYPPREPNHLAAGISIGAAASWAAWGIG